MGLRNTVEQHIVEIISEEEMTNDFGHGEIEFVKVVLTTNCYGNIRTGEEIFFKDDWLEAKAKGYWLA